MRKRSEQVPGSLPPICQRVAWLLLHAWGNSVTGMARFLEVSQPALSRVLAGQKPSGKMLEALAKKAGINLRWLLLGEGAEMADAGAMPGASLCPLALALLDAPPASRPELLASLSLPVASHRMLEAAYWVRVQPGEPITRDVREKVAEGDYLLVETSANWTSRPEAYLNRLVVLRRAGQPPMLARVRDDDYFGEGRHSVDTFGAVAKAVLVPGSKRPEAKPGRRKEETEAFYGDDVAGVVLQVARLL